MITLQVSNKTHSLPLNLYFGIISIYRSLEVEGGSSVNPSYLLAFPHYRCGPHGVFAVDEEQTRIVRERKEPYRQTKGRREGTVPLARDHVQVRKIPPDD